MSRDPHRLTVFHHSHELVLAIYRLTDKLPVRERFGMQAQLRRAAVSISSNIVEGAARRSVGDYARFLDIAVGSAAEVRYLLLVTADLGMLSEADLAHCRELSDHVVRALQNLRTAVSRLDRS
jgi:four helix bundle protein